MHKLLLVCIVTALLLFGGSSNAAPAQDPGSSASDAAKAPRPSNKWRIKFNGSARSEGVIRFRVHAGDGSTLDVDVAVRDGQSENSVARAARDAFKAALGKAYKVETDDGEDVLVKVRGRTPDFGLALVSNAVEHIDIRLKRE